MKEQRLQLNCHWLKLFLILSLANVGYSQTTIKVIDENQKALIGAHVFFSGKTSTTNAEGFVNLTLQSHKENTIRFEYLGYKDLSLSLKQIQSKDYIVTMIPDKKLLDEIVIVGRTASSSLDMPNQVSRISATQINRSGAQNAAEALEYNAGAFIQKSQMGGGSPVLRGFEANKVLLVIDGIRMNNAIYRNGHLQNAVTIDHSMLENIDIIFGAGSLLYGSEALGGVVHYKSKSAELNYNNYKNNTQELISSIRYNSSSQEKRFHINHNFGKEKWAVRTSLSLVDFGNLRSGSNHSEIYPDYGKRTEYVLTNENGEDQVIINSNPNIQKFTAYSQVDFLQKWLFKWSNKLSSQFNIQYSSSSNIPRYDVLTERRNGELRYAEWYYGPQKRHLISHRIDYKDFNKFFDTAIFILSYQKIDEDRINRRLFSNIQENQFEDVNVYGATFDFKKKFNATNKLLYGADMHYNQVSSEAFSLKDPYQTNPLRQNDMLSRYPSGGSSLLNIGGFFQHNWQSQDSTLQWTNGLRYSFQNVSFKYSRDDIFLWPEYFYEGITNTSKALVGVSGFNYRNDHLKAGISTGSSFRAPNVDDLAKVRVNNDEISIPNPNLAPERVWNSELNLAYLSKKLNLSLTAYYSYLNDAIVRINSQMPDGSPFFIAHGDTLLVTANVNAQSAIIKGISIHVDINFNEHWKFDSQINLQKGRINSGDKSKLPLAHIPPSFGFINLSYLRNNYTLIFNARFNGWKRIEDFGGSVDNPDLATPEGSPSFVIYSLLGEFKINNNMDANIGFNNILDNHYRSFASGLSGAGRHVFVSLSYKWKK